MSYRNPQIYAADPMAFSRGFTEAFDKFQGMFEKEKAEREALKRQEEAALARGYAAADIGKINKIDLKLNQGLQQSLNSVVESRQFADATPAEQQRMLQELGVIKSSMQRIGEIAAIDPENWDSRNSKTLTAFRNAVLDGDDSIEVIGEGLNMRIKGSFGEITLDDISNAKVMTKEKYQDIFDNFQDKFTTTAIKRVEQVAKIGGNVEAEKQRIQEDYKKQLRAQGPELLSYLYGNEVDSNIYDTYKSFVYADPNITKDLSNEQKDKFINDQFNSLAENMYSKAMDSFIDPTPYVVPPKPPTTIKTIGSGVLNDIENAGTGAKLQQFTGKTISLGNVIGKVVGATKKSDTDFLFSVEIGEGKDKRTVPAEISVAREDGRNAMKELMRQVVVGQQGISQKTKEQSLTLLNQEFNNWLQPKVEDTMLATPKPTAAELLEKYLPKNQ